MSRLLLLATGWFVFLASLRADTALLREALTKSGDDECWAYTETSREIDDKGRAGSETVVRFDPSKPFAEQFTPLKIDGKPPTERQRRTYRKRGEKRGAELEREAVRADATANPDDDSIIEVNGETISPDFTHAKVVSESGASATYEIPLRKTGRGGPPVEKFQLTLRVNRERRELENATLRLLVPMRVMLVAKVTSGEMRADYAVVDPKFPPVMTSFGGNLAGSLFFVKSGATFEEKRTDFERVKPYGDRFRVQIGPLKALPF